ncbi:hypothetical protein C1X22_28700, partial [Pseudomonas sp. DP16D-L5]
MAMVRMAGKAQTAIAVAQWVRALQVPLACLLRQTMVVMVVMAAPVATVLTNYTWLEAPRVAAARVAMGAQVQTACKEVRAVTVEMVAKVVPMVPPTSLIASETGAMAAMAATAVRAGLAYRVG